MKTIKAPDGLLPLQIKRTGTCDFYRDVISDSIGVTVFSENENKYIIEACNNYETLQKQRDEAMELLKIWVDTTEGASDLFDKTMDYLNKNKSIK